jgi:hypothetical protein
MATVTAFPALKCRLFGWPDYVRLTAAEAKAMARIHLGGLEALRTPTYSCACKTIDSLVRKGLLESLADCTLPDGTVRRGGLTPMGKDVAESCAENA